MKRSIIYGIVILALAFSAKLKAQQLPTYSQYLMNSFMVNPAMAGYDGYTTVNLTSRQQWLGFKEAPRTYSASWQTRLFRKGYKIVNRPLRRGNMLIPSTKGRVGLGAYVTSDINAKVSRTGLSFTYAYHIIIDDQQLSFGLAGKFFQYRINTNELTFGEDGDPIVNGGYKEVGYSPDADFGVLFNGLGYYLGFSVTNLLQTSLMIGASELPDFKTYRHYWLLGGYRYRINYDWEIEPSFFAKTSENWNPQAEGSLRVHYLESFWAGMSYRSNNTLIALVGVRIDNILFGYSFDWSFSEIGNYNYGSHEICLAVKLGDNQRKTKSRNRY